MLKKTSLRRGFLLSGAGLKNCDPLRKFPWLKINPLFNGRSCVCINSVNFSTQRPLMNASMLTSTLLKTAPAAVVVVRVVVVVGNAP
jgi:hypothetical protein